MYRRIVVSIMTMALVLVLGPVEALAQGQAGTNPEILPPQSHAFGKSLGEWGAAWWQWAFSFPADRSPVTDPDGRFCAEGQSGKVWFLAGTTGGTATRTCTIPTGTPVLI